MTRRRIVLEPIEHAPPVCRRQLDVERNRVRPMAMRERQSRVAARSDNPAKSHLPRHFEQGRREGVVVFDNQHHLVPGRDHAAVVGEVRHQLVLEDGRKRRRLLHVTHAAIHFCRRRQPVLQPEAGQSLAYLRQVEREGAALAHGAPQPDVAAEQPRELLADRQAQPGAAVLPAGRAVRLLERLEDDLVLLRRNADARVDDGERHCGRSQFDQRIARRPLAGDRDLEPDATALGELERVRQQVL